MGWCHVVTKHGSGDGWGSSTEVVRISLWFRFSKASNVIVGAGTYANVALFALQGEFYLLVA